MYIYWILANLRGSLQMKKSYLSIYVNGRKHKSSLCHCYSQYLCHILQLWKNSFFFLQDDHIGIINISMCPKSLVEKWATFVKNLAQDKYGHTPDIRISGHVSTRFPYIEMPLDYIFPELLKNAVRATIEAHPGSRGKSLPPVYVTIATNERDFIFK